MYGIRVIEDHELPDEFDWALVECRDTGREFFLVKRRAVGDPQVFADGWAAYRMMDRAHTPCRQDTPNDQRVSFLPLPRVG